MGWRHALSAIAALAVLALSVPALRWAVADWYASSDPDYALAWIPDHPRALEFKAAAALSAGNLNVAEAAARAAIAQRPLEDRPWRILAAVYEASTRLPDARAAHRAAVAVAPATSYSHLWLASQAMSEGNFDEGLMHLDRALRVSPSLSQSVFPALAADFARPGVTDALLRYLESRPPWRLGFLDEMARRQDLTGVPAFFAALAARSPLMGSEARAWTNRLEQEQRWSELSILWQAGTFERGARPAQLLNDGGFNGPLEDYGLGWRIQRRPGVVTVIGMGGGSPSGGAALTLQFLNQRVPYRDVGQLLLLPPGRYQLRGEVKTESLRTSRGLRWSLSCVATPGTVIARTDSYKGTRPWTRFAVLFNVPEGCMAQYLVLEVDANGPSEEWVGGVIRFDGLSIDPQNEASS